MGLEQYKSLNKFYCPLHLSLNTYTTTLHWAARLMLSALMQIILVITETALALHYNLHGCNCNWVYIGAAQQHPLRLMKNSGPQMAAWSTSDRNIWIDASLSPCNLRLISTSRSCYDGLLLPACPTCTCSPWATEQAGFKTDLCFQIRVRQLRQSWEPGPSVHPALRTAPPSQSPKETGTKLPLQGSACGKHFWLHRAASCKHSSSRCS